MEEVGKKEESRGVDKKGENSGVFIYIENKPAQGCYAQANRTMDGMIQ